MLDSLPPAGLTPPALIPAGRAAETSRPTAEANTDDRKRASPVRDSARLDEAEMATLRALQQRDRQVRAHEMAHVAVGGPLILRGAQFDYETGPDGVRYAIGGDVLIDTSPAPTPEETVDKADHIRATALAPADPSPQDRQVAAMASQMSLQAQMEIAAQRREEGMSGDTSEAGNTLAAGPPPATGRIQAAYTSADGSRFNTPGSLIDTTS